MKTWRHKAGWQRKNLLRFKPGQGTTKALMISCAASSPMMLAKTNSLCGQSLRWANQEPVALYRSSVNKNRVLFTSSLFSTAWPVVFKHQKALGADQLNRSAMICICVLSCTLNWVCTLEMFHIVSHHGASSDSPWTASATARAGCIRNALFCWSLLSPCFSV